VALVPVRLRRGCRSIVLGAEMGRAVEKSKIGGEMVGSKNFDGGGELLSVQPCVERRRFCYELMHETGL
jgi:hypothetical protein